MKAFAGFALAAALLSATAVVAPGHAATIPSGPISVAGPEVIQVSGGCGINYHRDGAGFCAPNWREWQVGWRACPVGWHLGPAGRRCWPN